MSAENKTKPTAASVPAFIDSVEDPNRRAEAQTVVKLMKKATGEKPALWGPSIIGFGSHHYKYETGREGDSPIVAFSPRKAAVVFYGITGTPEAEALLPKLGKHTMGKGCLYLKKLSDADTGVLEELILKAFTAKAARKSARS